MKKLLVRFCLLLPILALSACGPRYKDTDFPGFKNGKKIHPSVKVGSEYSVDGRSYDPYYDPDYSETGMASWYGPGFHSKRTANGEKYDQHAMTAAHPTLPMPSMVRVTNLKNGKTVVVRINDRGPYAHNRIIDVSRAAAERLEMIKTGVAKVKVEYLPEETEEYLAKLSPDFQRKHWKKQNPLYDPEDDIQAETELAFMPESDEPPRTADAAEVEKVTSTDLPPPDEIKLSDDTDSEAPTKSEKEEKPLFAWAKPAYADVRKTPAESGDAEAGYTSSSFETVDETAEIDEAPPLVLNKHKHKWDDDPPFKVVKKADIKPPEVKVADAKPSGTASENLMIRAGTFKSMQNAKKLSKQLDEVAGVQIEEIKASDMSVFRVNVGPLRSQELAEEMIQRLEEMGIHDAWIIR